MIELKRDLVKYIRDRAKSGYKKSTECYICGDSSKLDFHHFYSLSPLLHRWVKKHKKIPEEVLEFRDEFILEHTAELYDHTVTLCHEHHLRLHSIYGKDPSLATAMKQKKWVDIQRTKHGLV
jgi:hypothetical protein|tara:strand:- start:42 stop:407 length:366 start_codon:yes stop_codon:yes gene_type:complete